LEFSNEPILQGPKEPLDPPLGLRRQSVDGFNGKFLQGPSYLGRILPAPKLLLKAPMRVIALKGAVPILVDGKGDPIFSQHLT
jgi:phospholipid N-methyltransferase